MTNYPIQVADDTWINPSHVKQVCVHKRLMISVAGSRLSGGSRSALSMPRTSCNATPSSRPAPWSPTTEPRLPRPNRGAYDLPKARFSWFPASACPVAKVMAAATL